MVVVIIGILLGAGILVWIWKVPVSRLVESMKESGSSTFEAYFFLTLFIVATLLAVVMITHVI